MPEAKLTLKLCVTVAYGQACLLVSVWHFQSKWHERERSAAGALAGLPGLSLRLTQGRDRRTRRCHLSEFQVLNFNGY